jgi:hypothetical protein
MDEMSRETLYHGIPIAGRMPLFTANMRQAIRDNLKTQTRRLNGLDEINENPGAWEFMGFENGEAKFTIPGFATRGIKPPWAVGDVRCMCESLVRGMDGMTYYRDDVAPYHVVPVISLVTGNPIPWHWKRDYLASIHMPTEAARTIRKTTDIRVEKLQEIGPEDAIREGYPFNLPPAENWEVYVDWYRNVWDSLYAAKGYGWDVPQWVFVNAFEKLEV